MTSHLERWADEYNEAHEAEQEAERTLRVARGAVLTRKRAATILEAVRAGKTVDQAAELAGVHPAAVDEWVDRGEQHSAGVYHEFVHELHGEQLRQSAGKLAEVSRIAVPFRYRPHRRQQVFHAWQLQRDKRWARLLAACCGRRGGKTKGGGAHFATNYVRDLEDKLTGRGRWEGQPHGAWQPSEGKDAKPFLRYAVVAPTYALLDEPKIALRESLGLVAEGGCIVHQSDKIWWLLGGVRIDFLSGDRPERLVSHGYDGVWFDEAARLKPSVWRDNMRPTLSDQRGWALFTTTPLGKNWFWEDIWARGNADGAAELAQLLDKTAEEIRDREVRCVAWTTADNTAIPALAEEMEVARRQMPEALFRRNYYADFNAFEGQCFDLVAHRHRNSRVAYPLSSLRRAWVGIDYGMTHRTSICIVAEDYQGKLHELHTESAPDVLPHSDDAWRKRDQGDRSVWSTRLYHALCHVLGPKLWHRIPVYVPADRQDWRRYLEGCGFQVHSAYQEHEPAVTWMQMALFNDAIDIRSPLLWRCLTNLRYPADGESSSKLWVDKDDDEWDSLRYACTELIRDGQVFGVDRRVLKAVAGWASR